MQFRLGLVGNNRRAQRVIETAARIAAWGSNQPGRAKGFTFVDYSSTYMAAVADPREAAVVCTPGNGFGVHGEGYVRFALSVDVSRLEEAVERIGKVL